MENLKSLLVSRKFWLCTYALLQTIILHYFSVPTDILVAMDALVMVLIGAIAYENVNQAK